MTMEIPYLKNDMLEEAAERLLSDYFEGKEFSIPIPVHEILENHLGLYPVITSPSNYMAIIDCDPDDLLGAIFFEKKEVLISDKLQEDSGRYNFTIAHEIGHWILHRAYVKASKGQIDFFKEDYTRKIICRESKQKSNTAEGQANKFAAALLMPKKYVEKQITGMCESGRIPLDDLKRYRQGMRRHPLLDILAEQFQVSKMAMSYRLQNHPNVLERAFSISNICNHTFLEINEMILRKF